MSYYKSCGKQIFNTKQIIFDSGIIFGTSGARGLASEFTPAVCAAFCHAFVSLIRRDSPVNHVALAIDNRPSSYFMAQACAAALLQAGVEPIYYGVIPTPALAYQAMQDNIPCIMVTGSHIPFDRNGLKFYRQHGEISKVDEQEMLAVDMQFPLFIEFPKLVVNPRAAINYCRRYSSLFSADQLAGKRIGIYEHSSAGRDLYAQIFESLGAEVVRLDRSDKFVPIDTEAVAEEDKIKARRWSCEYNLDAIFSTDGDGDRPLVADENGEWLRGDILGILCADALGIEALAIPISSNTAVISCGHFTKVVLTRIGSPYVIAEFHELSKKYKRIAGFEANGGFLLGSDIDFNGKQLTALSTRDAVLPFLMLLVAAGMKNISLLVSALPQRFTYSDRIKDFPMERSQKILLLATSDPIAFLDSLGLADINLSRIDMTDGLRLELEDGRIVHLRPSGNAPELRCYAEADDVNTAHELVSLVLGKLEKMIFNDQCNKF